MLAVALLFCCSRQSDSTKEPLAAASTPEADPRAEALWSKHLETIEHAAQTGYSDRRAFYEACKFFEDLTGITVPFDHSAVADFYPTRDTAKALEPLRAWYAANGDRLLWDETSKAVKLRPAPG